MFTVGRGGGRPPRPSPWVGSEAPFADLAGWLGVSPNLGSIRQIEVAILAVAALLAGLAITLATGVLVVLGVAFLIAALAEALGSFYMRRRMGSWGYLEREQDLLVRRGLLFQRLSVVPYGRMQTVDVTAGPLERLFGLASIRLHTASAGSDCRIPGLPSEVAAGLRDRLARLGEANAEGL
jgi:membrane protein YdbS with pleckstrin-like domain